MQRGATVLLVRDVDVGGVLRCRPMTVCTRRRDRVVLAEDIWLGVAVLLLRVDVLGRGGGRVIVCGRVVLLGCPDGMGGLDGDGHGRGR